MLAAPNLPPHAPSQESWPLGPGIELPQELKSCREPEGVEPAAISAGASRAAGVFSRKAYFAASSRSAASSQLMRLSSPPARCCCRGSGRGAALRPPPVRPRSARRDGGKRNAGADEIACAASHARAVSFIARPGAGLSAVCRTIGRTLPGWRESRPFGGLPKLADPPCRLAHALVRLRQAGRTPWR